MDKFIVRRSASGDALRPMAVREGDFELFKQIASDANAKQVDLFHDMVVFCAARLDIKEDE